MAKNRPLVANEAEASGRVTPAVLDNIASESERVHAAVVGARGLTRIDGDEKRRVDVAIVLVLTDRRIVFTAAESGGSEDGSLSLSELAGADVAANCVELSTIDGITWRFPLPDDADADVEAVARDIDWIGRVRSRVVAAHNDVELAAGRIREAADERNWEAGIEAYREARATLDDLIQAIDRTEPVPDDQLAPDLTEIERTLEGAYADLLVDRAQSRLTLGQQLTENGDIEQAAELLKAARTDFAAASARADLLERGDAFRFGEQRAILNRLERLEWEIAAVAAEPLRQAHEAKLLAQTAVDPEATLEHWKAAFQRFGSVLALDRDFDHDAVEDVPDARAELVNAAEHLLAIHQTLARTDWDAGVEHHEAGESEAAVEHLSNAVDHLERAHELAEEFRPEAASTLADRLATLRNGLARVREVADGVRAGDDGDGQIGGTSAADATESGDGEITASELEGLDTHQEVVLGERLGDGTQESAENGELLQKAEPEDAA